MAAGGAPTERGAAGAESVESDAEEPESTEEVPETCLRTPWALGSSAGPSTGAFATSMSNLRLSAFAFAKAALISSARLKALEG